MTFNPALPFKTLTAFDPSKSFERLDVPFNPEKTYEVIDDSKPQGAMFKAKIVKGKEEMKPEILDARKVVDIVLAELKKIPKQKPLEKIIEKQIIKEIAPLIKEEKFDMKIIDNLKEEIKKLSEIVKEQQKIIQFDMANRGGAGVIGIPPPEGNESKVLTVSGNRAQWKAASSGSTGQVYTTSNVTTKRNLDPTMSTVDDLYNVLASLIVDLRSAGILS